MKPRCSARLPALLLGLVVATAALLAAVAHADGSAHSNANRAPRLSTRERRAVAISSIAAEGSPSLGLFVTVRFRGNIARYLGQGALAHAVLALVLTPRSGGSPARGLVDSGGGFAFLRALRATYRHGHLIVSPATVQAFGSERLLHVGLPRTAEVVRYGNQALFYVPGGAFDPAMRVTVKVFARAPVAAGRPPSQAAWQAILDRRATDVASSAVTALDCPRVAPARSALAALVGSTLRSELLHAEQLRGWITATLHALGSSRPRAILSRYLAGTQRRIGALKSEISSLRPGVSALGTAFQVCSSPPPVPAPASAPTPVPPAPTPPAPAPPPPAVTVVQTDPAQSQFMAAQPPLALSSSSPSGLPVIDVNDQIHYQQFAGLGAAMTDSSAWLIANKLTAANRLALMQALFGAGGTPTALGAPAIHLDYLRVGVGATGAMTVTPPYSYDDNANQPDPTLSNFSIAHDQAYIIPTLQQALTIDPALQILASPWSPPAWMKTNDSLGNIAAGGSLLPSDYGTYANYIVKFIQAYEADGIPISAITAANEPTSGSGGSQYPGLNLPEANEAQFIAQDLHPALNAAGLHTKIYGNDLSWDEFSPYASPLAADPNAGPALAGMAWHCYFGSPTVMSQLQQQAPGLDQVVDECSPEIRSFGTPEFLISTLRNWASVDAIWSVALDPSGQPIQPGNHCGGCRGAVSIDQTTGAVAFLPEYYELGQVSAFVQPGASRIDSPNFVSYGVNTSNIETITAGLDDVAFLNPDGSKVLVAYNNSAAPISFDVASSSGDFTYTIPAQAMTTFVWT